MRGDLHINLCRTLASFTLHLLSNVALTFTFHGSADPRARRNPNVFNRKPHLSALYVAVCSTRNFLRLRMCTFPKKDFLKIAARRFPFFGCLTRVVHYLLKVNQVWRKPSLVFCAEEPAFLKLKISLSPVILDVCWQYKAKPTWNHQRKVPEAQEPPRTLHAFP